MNLLEKLTDVIFRAVKHRPYFHITDASGQNVYMERYWIFGSGTERDRQHEGVNPRAGWLTLWLSQYFVARLHHIRRSDLDRDLHDHPAWNVSIVLKGGYWELTPHPKGSHCPFFWALFTSELFENQSHIPADWRDVVTNEPCVALWRGPGSIVVRRAKSRHKLVLPDNSTTWSIFCLGRRSNHWGFYTSRGKVPHEQYASVSM